ncbi:Crp/Fnr family transcriptional regulator [Marinobacter mobilis]|uniref:cAMP-binding domain of CRP or a regulatory subunit of cAMP-dependent protein kinases n=1 Tax=Marinobacter mobilis TaxID=488533 RepID=A0A1H2RAC9_9GAMM|nr:Crp/Fnr family transcriptional regulator [Marinobacter mobilis]SDW16321.1 cAMP-binding domain of CRP or a regulatory subunit of cAMP-dependent protein kinases [Marinobacter mobilis]
MINIKTVLKGCPLLAGLPDRALDDAAAMARQRQFVAGESIYDAGSMQSSLCVIASGTVRVSSVNAAGKEATLIIFGAGAWLGDTVFSPGMPRVYGATAHEPATIVEVPGEGFRHLMAEFPESYPVALDLVSRRLWAAMSIIEDDALRGIDARFGRRMLFLVQIQGDGSLSHDPVAFDLTREHIANMMGMSRQGVHKVIKHFESQGLLDLSYGRITVLDPVALQAYLNTLN